MKKIVFTCLLSSIITGCGSDSSSSSEETTAFENQLINDFGVELNDIRTYCNSDAISCYLNDNNEPIAEVIIDRQAVGCAMSSGSFYPHVMSQTWNIDKSTINVAFVEYFGECAGSPSASEFISYQLMQNESYLEDDVTTYTIPQPTFNEIDTENSTQYVGLKSTFSITPEVMSQEQLIELVKKHSHETNISSMSLFLDDVELYFTGTTISTSVKGNLLPSPCTRSIYSKNLGNLIATIINA